LHRLVVHCTAVGADPNAWRERLARAARVLFDAGLCLTGEIEHVWEPARARSLSLIEAGWRDEAQRRGFLGYLQSGAYASDPSVLAMLPHRAPLVVKRRGQIQDMDQWRRSACYRRYYHRSGFEDMLISICALRPPRTQSSSMIVLHRVVGAPAFTDADVRRMTCLTRALRPLIGRRLATADDPVAALPPRKHAALRLLLGGLAETDAADRLGVSPGTFHKYVTEIYRRFGVHSRAQLQARFVGRGRLAPMSPRQEMKAALRDGTPLVRHR